MNDIWETLTDEKELSKMKQRRLSLIFLFIACVQIFIPYDRGFWDTIKNFETELSIMPDFTSGFLGILIIVPLYARNILKLGQPHQILSSSFKYSISNAALYSFFFILNLSFCCETRCKASFLNTDRFCAA